MLNNNFNNEINNQVPTGLNGRSRSEEEWVMDEAGLRKPYIQLSGRTVKDPRGSGTRECTKLSLTVVPLEGDPLELRIKIWNLNKSTGQAQENFKVKY